MNYLDQADLAIKNKDLKKALELLEKAINNKEYEALSIIGMYYINGIEVEKNIDKGLDYLFIGDKHDDPKCISILGDLYYQGKYLNQDLEKAKAYYTRASLLLEPHSIGMLGLLEYNESNYEKAIDYFKSGALANDLNSIYYLAICAYNGYGMDKDYDLSFELFNKLYNENKNNKDLIKYLADSYFNGYGTTIDFIKAKELYKLLSDEDSIFNLGLIYKNNLKEYDKAFECFKKIKNVKSQFEQALMLYNGLGVEENKVDAYFKFYACATLKYAYSYPFVGDSYFYGYGVKKDYFEAIKWYKMALDENIPNQYINISSAYIKLKKYDLALENLLKEKDSINKNKMLGEIYYKLKKYDLAYNSYLSNYEFNDSYSIYKLYKMAKKGKGIKKDKELILKYYLKYNELMLLEDSEKA